MTDPDFDTAPDAADLGTTTYQATATTGASGDSATYSIEQEGRDIAAVVDQASRPRILLGHSFYRHWEDQEPLYLDGLFEARLNHWLTLVERGHVIEAYRVFLGLLEETEHRQDLLAHLVFAGLIDVQDRMFLNRSYTTGHKAYRARATVELSHAVGWDEAHDIVYAGVPDIAAYTRMADILIGAAGVPGIIQPEMVKPGAVVVSGGITYEGRRVIPDVSEEVGEVASWITPRLGGVGPTTVAMLLRNTVTACIARSPRA